MAHDPIDDVWDLITQDNQTNFTAADAQGMKANNKGDFQIIQTAVKFNAMMIFGYTALFIFLRHRFPLVFCYYATGNDGEPIVYKTHGNQIDKEEDKEAHRAPRTLPHRDAGLAFHWGWIPAAFNITRAGNLEESIGLDQALMLEFCNLCIRIFATISIPMVVIMCPLHYFTGVNEDRLDRISITGMSNIGEDSILWWIHAALVPVIVFTVTRYLHQAQNSFAKRRYKWLDVMGEPRATTVLVQGIPQDHRADQKLEEYFVKMFSRDLVDSAHVVKDTKKLADLVAKLEAEARELRSSIFEYEHSDDKGDGKVRPLLRKELQETDAISHHSEQVTQLLTGIQRERAEALEQAEHLGGINSNCGFVRFTHQRQVQVAVFARFSLNEMDWWVTRAPEPADVAFSNLASEEPTGLRKFCGYMMILALFNFYVTIIVGITRTAEFIKNNAGPLRSLLEAIVPTIGLLLFMSFLPTILLIIFRSCFTFDSESTLQKLLYKWYFWFLVVSVLLVTLVGTSPALLVLTIARDPANTPALLASTLPGASNFYITYVLIMMSAHFLNLTRYINIIKYWIYRIRNDSVRAWAYSEPEDQDYYGLGSRSARWSIAAVIGLVYIQLCPVLGLLVLVHFLICRLVYGYLVCYAETRKPDMGGEIWVDQLNSVYQMLVLYILLMTGVVIAGGGNLCGIISSSGFLVLFLSYRAYRSIWWRNMPFEVLPSPDGDGTMPGCTAYVQPELLESKVEKEANDLVEKAANMSDDDDTDDEDVDSASEVDGVADVRC